MIWPDLLKIALDQEYGQKPRVATLASVDLEGRPPRPDGRCPPCRG